MTRLTLLARWLSRSPAGTVLLWVVLALGALGGVMCLTSLRVGR